VLLSKVKPDSAIAPSGVPSEVSILVNKGVCTVVKPVPELPLVPDEQIEP
jgi:hypothetical protein